MLSVRNAIVSASLLFLLSLILSVVQMLQTPDSDGRGNDSFGTRGGGFRALFETLERLEVPVSRNLAPPRSSRLPDGTLAILEPGKLRGGTGSIYLKRLDPWWLWL